MPSTTELLDAEVLRDPTRPSKTIARPSERIEQSDASVCDPATSSSSVICSAAQQIVTVTLKELRDAFRNRWFLLYAILFAVLTTALASLSLAGTGATGMAGFGRTAAGLVNIVLLIVPLMALTTGAGVVAGERERGTLEYLLSHPLTRSELLIGKYLGSAIALLTALLIGFAISMLVVARHSGGRGHVHQVESFLTLICATSLLALAMLSVGLLISVLSSRNSVAVGAAILVWFSLVFLTDLGLMGSTLAFKLQVRELFALALLNPMQVFKMSVLSSIHASLDVLGPAGTYATRSYGAALPALFAASAAAWIAVPALIAYVVFTRRGDAS